MCDFKGTVGTAIALAGFALLRVPALGMLAALIAVPLGVGTAAYLSEIASARLCGRAT